MLHEIGSNIVPIVAIVMIFGGGAIQHFVKSLGRAIELKASQQNGVNAETAKAIEALRREVAALRETSTQFDMSFDAAITRLEHRMERVEGQGIADSSSAQIASPTRTYTPSDTAETVTLSVGRGA